MADTRMTEFRAATPEAADRLHGLLAEGAAIYSAAPHCRSCRLLRDRDDPQAFVMVEVWDDIAHRAAAAKTVPAHVVEQASAIMAGPPQARSFAAA